MKHVWIPVKFWFIYQPRTFTDEHMPVSRTFSINHFYCEHSYRSVFILRRILTAAYFIMSVWMFSDFYTYKFRYPKNSHVFGSHCKLKSVKIGQRIRERVTSKGVTKNISKKNKIFYHHNYFVRLWAHGRREQIFQFYNM